MRRERSRALFRTFRSECRLKTRRARWIFTLPMRGKSPLRWLRIFGPGVVTGASDDDPSGIATYSQAGAQFGMGLLWTMALSYPLMAAIQEVSARVGRVTGHGLAGNVCRHFPAPFPWMLLAIMFIANTVNIAADLGAMGDAVKPVIGGPAAPYVVVLGIVPVA